MDVNTIIRKEAADLKVTPNLDDYEKTRSSFSWSQVPDLCAGMGSGLCNIGYAAVDRHAEGPEAGRTALRFIADEPGAQTLSTHDVSYAELGHILLWLALAKLGVTSALLNTSSRAHQTAWPRPSGSC